ncbi:MAG: LysR family transcriptional regulator [Solobacterium sp.]|jgi:DNA-binding transcriptional LysR family regulator|nr:LysR family transcriptional regulator [Solobacterium sp.]MCH4206569.1 LysR family transcriptional regulator [Solobacterium sp.]MCH4228023.1 LysR family transcriptional regulator [Solobacterium sp.]MCH4283442.1 LysR family transcriptional regulator [Solobacterium sp.]
MDYIEVKYMKMIAECGSVTAAAKKLFISQPALSKYLHQHEKEIGEPLFSKKDGRLRPTELGRIYLHYADIIIDAEKQCNQEMKMYTESHKKNMIFGVPSSRLSDLQPLIQQFKDSNPAFQFTMIPDSSRAIFEQVKNKNMDIAITNAYEDDPKGITLKKEEIELLIPKALQKKLRLHSHILSSMDCLKNCRFFLSNANNLYGWIAQKIFCKESFHPDHIEMMNNSLLAGALAAENDGISLSLKPKDSSDPLNQDLFTIKDHHYFNYLCLYQVTKKAKMLNTSFIRTV